MPELVHTQIRDASLRRTARAAKARSVIRRGDYSADSGARATRSLLAGAQPPTAIVYDSDVMALGGIRAAAELGLEVPHDLSVVAWDDSIMCELARPQITAVHRDIQGYGAEVARRLLLEMGDGRIDSTPLTPPRLIERQTVSIPRS